MTNTNSLPWFINLAIWLVAMFWMFTLISAIRRIPSLWDMHNFYHYLLNVSNKDMQSITWQDIVGRLMALRDHNLVTANRDSLNAESRRYLKGQSMERMDAHDIANRLMRKENYWIAIINRDILDYSIPIPFYGKSNFTPGLCNGTWVWPF